MLLDILSSLVKEIILFPKNLFYFIRNILREKNELWIEVKYPRNRKNYFFYFLLLLTVYFLLYLTLEFIYFLTSEISSIVFYWLYMLLAAITWGYLIIKGMEFYQKSNERTNKVIDSRLHYLIHTLGLYDEETFEIVEDGKTAKVKRIVRVIRIFYREKEKFVYVRVMRDGDRFTEIASSLGENLQSALGLELESVSKNVNYAEYKFLKKKDSRIDLSLSVNKLNISDVIQITGNISYELSKTPHSLIVGGTGSGKSYFILGKIVSYLNLTPQADLRIIDPKKADLSLLRFIIGFEDKVATEPSQICKMLREVVELMEQRYSEHFNSVSAFGKTYRDFNLPIVIVIFDEFSAFIHSVDKKIAKEALDYIFQIVMKGRQAGVMVEILMQRPSADDLPTNIRAQMGFKAGLGAMDSIGYNMIFDTNDIEYKTVVEKGGGYIQIDGVHTAPVYFETPYIEKDFNFIAEIEKLMQVNRQMDGEERKLNESIR